MREIMQTMQFTAEEIAYFLDLDAKLTDAARERIEFLKARYLRLTIDDNFAEGEWRTNNKVGEVLGYLGEGMGVHPYAMHMLFLIKCAEWLPGEYERRGLDAANAVNMLQDIRYKLRECEKMEGFMGTSTYNWFHRHFLVTRFALGRFQYDPSVWEYENDYVFGDYRITRGDKIVRFHIPSSGPMTREMRLDSYRRCWEFFKPESGIMNIVCGSWLLYGGNREVYPEGSNLMDFMDDFDLIESHEDKNSIFSNAWRVFYKNYTGGDPSYLPQETTLQRNYVKWLAAGNKVGGGTGVILFDGEKIINNKRDN